MKKIIVFILVLVLGVISLNCMSKGAGKTGSDFEAKKDTLEIIKKIDDWQLDYSKKAEDLNIVSPIFSNVKMAEGTHSISRNHSAPQASYLESIVGLAVGGAKDADNFRLNIEEGYLPQPSAITYEGLFYDYYFNTEGIDSKSKNLFSPSYNILLEQNQRTGKDELWLSVGLNSNMKESDFSRKKLNLVVVLDISGSMSSGFNDYYYDGTKKIEVEDFRRKMEIANEAICNMLGHLEAEDRFGMVLFNNSAHLAKPMNLVGETDMEKIKGHIMEIQPGGGTNMYAGMSEGSKLFESYLNVDKSEYENRIIFLTDAMPNRELTDKHSLWGVMQENAEKGLYSTIIGVGVDFQTELVEHISKVEGANYYSIHSGKEFKQRLDEEFEFMVTPLVFNLNLVVDAAGYKIKRVCGTPYAHESTGEIMRVGTLFPSATKNGEVKGGIILVELERNSEEGEIYLIAGYDDRKGKHFQDRVKVDFKKELLSSQINNGVQKGVLLVHYADLLMEWTEYMRNPESGEKKQHGKDDWQYKMRSNPNQRRLNEWEQKSMPLTITNYYHEEMKSFKERLAKRIPQLRDEDLNREVELLELIIKNAKIKEDIRE